MDDTDEVYMETRYFIPDFMVYVVDAIANAFFYVATRINPDFEPVFFFKITGEIED